jgi:hypothetical protein
MTVKHAALSAALVGLGLAAPPARVVAGESIATFSDDWAEAPSAVYARMGAVACKRELVRRGIGFTEVRDARGVLAPVRIPAGLAGVRFRTALPPDKGATSPWEVFDCRLVLALHDFASILRAHGIDDVLIFSAWRPARAPAATKPKRGRKKARHRRPVEARRHPAALAVDVQRFGKRVPGALEADRAVARTWLDVERDFHGRIGAETCGPSAPPPDPPTPEALEMRALVCEAAAARMFTSMLTPNYDAAHRNHLHLEVTPKVRWRIVR